MKSTDQASESSKVGIAPRFQSALELCGRTDQDGMSVAHYGYLAHIHGLPLDELFPTGRQSVRTSFEGLANPCFTGSPPDDKDSATDWRPVGKFSFVSARIPIGCG